MSPGDEERAAQWDALNRSIVTARLVSAMVHDARNILQGIAGTAELVVATLGAEHAKQTERVSHILSKSLTLGERLETFRSMQEPAEARPERLDLAQLCARATESRQATWAPRQISANIDIESGLMVRGDAIGLLRIVLNLILNSERALIDARGGLISLSAEAGAESARLVIEDSGAGVAPEAEPFLFQLEGPDGRITTGLWTAARLASFFGAQIAWLGPAGRRSAFEVVLPLGG